MIYLDHAATTPVGSEVLAAMTPYFSASFGNASGGYGLAREARQAIDAARGELADAMGAQRSEVYFTSGGSESDTWAILGAATAQMQKKHIITSRIEHHAVLRACAALERWGWQVTYLDVDEKGRVSKNDFLKAIRPDTLLATVMMANNEVGTIEPIAELTEIAHAHGILMHTDAVQAAGHIPIRLDELPLDLLSLSAHKFGGPKGVGALVVRGGVRLNSLIFGGAQERGLRAGTENVPGIVGMARALSLSVQHMAENTRRISRMRDALERALMDIPGIWVNGDRENRLPGHLHVTVAGMHSAALLMRLDMAGIAASSGSACASGAAERSHVLQATGAQAGADVRFSLGSDNTEDEIAAVAAAMRQILKR